MHYAKVTIDKSQDPCMQTVIEYPRPVPKLLRFLLRVVNCQLVSAEVAEFNSRYKRV